MVWCLLTRILTAIGSVSSYTAILTTLPQEFNTNYATVLVGSSHCYVAEKVSEGSKSTRSVIIMRVFIFRECNQKGENLFGY